MSDNDIIKVLECCKIDTPPFMCEECPLCRIPSYSCASKCKELAYDLIIRQKAEIERLKNMIAQNEGVLPEYERLIKAETIEEFAERLKHTRVDLDGIEMVAVWNIDTIIEQMTEELK